MTFLNPEKILEQIDLEEGMAVADFGSGSGYFVFPAAKKVGKEGKVWAVDILEPPLEAILSRAKLAGFENVETIRSDLEKPKGSTLKASSVNLVLVANILFQAEDENAIIEEAARILKKGGELLVVEWLPEKILNSREVHPMEKEEAKNLILKNEAFKFVKDLDAGEYHYGLLFRKSK